MKKIIFWVFVTLAYEIGVVGFGSYWLGGKIGECLLLKKK